MRGDTLEAAAFTKTANRLPIVVQRIDSVDTDVSKLTFTLASGKEKANLNEAALNDSLLAIYQNKVRLAPSSLAKLSDQSRSGIYQCFVRRNGDIVPYETASSEGWTCVAANVFADDADNIWEVSGEGESRVLRRRGVDDLDAVLAERRTRSVDTALSLVSNVPAMRPRDFITFYDADKEDYRHGIALSTEKAYVPSADGDGKIVEIAEASIVRNDQYDVDYSPSFLDAPSIEQASKADVLAYYKKLYGHNKEFYAKLASLVRDHLAV